MKKVVIVEKVKNIRDGIKILINRFSDLICEESFDSFESLHENINQIDADILLVQSELKGNSFINKIKDLKTSYPDLAIVLLTLNEENEIIYDALANGAASYVHKNAPAQKLVRVLEDAANRKITINSIVARRTEKYIRENKLEGLFEQKELLLLQKVTEGNNIPAIEKSLKVDGEDIKKDFWKIFERIFDINTNNMVAAKR
jgi:DNA-binding NarL/FixJ family response regulator